MMMMMMMIRFLQPSAPLPPQGRPAQQGTRGSPVGKGCGVKVRIAESFAPQWKKLGWTRGRTVHRGPPHEAGQREEGRRERKERARREPRKERGEERKGKRRERMGERGGFRVIIVLINRSVGEQIIGGAHCHCDSCIKRPLLTLRGALFQQRQTE